MMNLTFNVINRNYVVIINQNHIEKKIILLVFSNFFFEDVKGPHKYWDAGPTKFKSGTEYCHFFLKQIGFCLLATTVFNP